MNDFITTKAFAFWLMLWWRATSLILKFIQIELCKTLFKIVFSMTRRAKRNIVTNISAVIMVFICQFNFFRDFSAKLTLLWETKFSFDPIMYGKITSPVSFPIIIFFSKILALFKSRFWNDARFNSFIPRWFAMLKNTIAFTRAKFTIPTFNFSGYGVENISAY